VYNLYYTHYTGAVRIHREQYKIYIVLYLINTYIYTVGGNYIMRFVLIYSVLLYTIYATAAVAAIGLSNYIYCFILVNLVQRPYIM